MLRNFGLAMFLATVGINAGQPFVRTVSETGLTMLFVGAAVLLTTVIIVLLVGYYLLKIPYDDLVGVASAPPEIPPSWCIPREWRRPSVPISATR